MSVAAVAASNAGVTLQKRTFQDQDLNWLQSDVASAVQELSQQDQPVITVLAASTSAALSGNEDYVLVDMSSAVKDAYLLLPSPAVMVRAVTVKLVKPGKAKLFVKASDNGSVLINTSGSPVQVMDSLKFIATPTQFYTV
jgi:hypothetical protein